MDGQQKPAENKEIGSNLFKSKAQMEEVIKQSQNYSLAMHLFKIHQASEQGAQQAAAKAAQKTKADGGQILDATASSEQEAASSTFFSTKPLDLLDIYIDAKDSVNNWCVAKILDHDIRNGRIHIHFDGWSNRYDETVRTGSSRIAPFRKYTQGYTGQSKVALRDFDLNYSYQVMLLNRIQRIIESNFLCFKDANECTQFVRGELYVYFDSLLTLVNEPSKSDIQKMFEFVTEVFNLCLKWIDMLDQDMVEMIRLCHKHSALYAVDIKAAIASCGFEIFDMIHKCMGLCERANRFFKQQPASLQYQTEYADPAKMEDLGILISLAGKFGELGGFDKLLELFHEGKRGKGFKCPVPLLSLSLKTIVKFREIGFKEKVANELFGNFRKAVDLCLKQENFKDSDIKDTSLEEIKWLIRLLSLLAETPEERYEMQEVREIEMSKRFLMCPYFEKRIRGMKEFKYIQEKILNRDLRPQVDQNNRPIRYEVTRYLDESIFSKWIIDNKVIDFIFEENPHQELIKRSQSILSLMAQDTNTFPERIIDLIWSCCSPEKHEDIIRATYELITELAMTLPLERLEYLYSKIQSLAVSSIDDKTVQFLRDYSINAIQNLKEIKRRQEQAKGKGASISGMFSRGNEKGAKKGAAAGTPSNQQSKAQNDFDRFVALQVFWDLAQDQNQDAQHKTKELALTSMIDVLHVACTLQNTIKEQYIQAALENIQKGDTVYITINFLRSLLNTYPRDDQIGFGQSNYGRQKGRNQQQDLSIESKIAQILKTTDINEAIIAQASEYMKYFKGEHKKQEKATNQNKDSQASASSASPSPSPSIGQIVSQDNTSSFSLNASSVTHEDYINCFIGFIEFIVINCRSLSLQFQHVQEMFRIFVTEAVTELETRQFFDFLTKQNHQARTRDRLHLLDEKLRFQVFTKIMCNEESMNCVHLNNQAYDCFHTLFLGVNNQEGNLVLDQGDGTMTQVNQFAQLQGINTMWKIAINCQDESVKEKCRNILCDLYLLTQSKNSRIKLNIQESFVKQCINNLQEAQDQQKKGLNSKENSKIIQNCLRLMRVYIQRYDKEHMIPELKLVLEQMTQQEQRNTRVIAIKLDPDGIQAEVEVNLNCKFWELMRICAQLFQIKMSEFFIFTKQGPLPNHMYNDLMREYDLKEVQLQRLPQERLETELPSYVIGFEADCINVLLYALKSKDDNITHETIALIDLLQISPKVKKYIGDSISKMKNIDTKAIEALNLNSTAKEATHANGADWQNLLKWQPNMVLNETFYMLSCLKDLITPKPSTQSGVQMNNARIIRQQNIPTSQAQAQQQERLAKIELQKQLLNKGGFHFLLYMLNNVVEKEVDFDKDILTSKTLQLLINLLDKLHASKLLQLLATIEKPLHLNELISSCLTIVKNYLETIQKRQIKKIEELKEKAKQDPSKAAEIHASVYGQMQFQPIETVILTGTLNFLAKILNLYPNNFQFLMKNEKLQLILRLGLIEIGHKKIQDKISVFSRNLCTKIEQQIVVHLKQQQSQEAGSKAGDQTQPLQTALATMLPSHIVLKAAIKEFVPLSLKESITQKMKTLYELMTQVFQETDVYKTLGKIEDPEKLVAKIIKMIYERDIREGSSRDEDVVLAGLFDFLVQILVRFQAVRQTKIQDKLKLIEFLIHHGLFKKEKRNQQIAQIQDQAAPKNLPPLCKHNQTRSSCLALLRALCLDDLRDKLFVTQYLQRNVCHETFWRTPRKVDWSIQVHQQDRALSGYVGLKNPGCICYMNSIMQNLYMIPAFRKLIIEVEDKQAADTPPEDNVLHQVKCIFSGLMEVEKQYFNPKKFCRAFKDYDGSPIDLYVQKDVDEFFNMFVDRIEGLIKGTKEEKVMTNLFQGVFANEFICKDCPHYSEREEPFMAVSLQVKNKNSILDSLKFYVEGEMLEGDNAYYCEKCEKKINTLKRQCIKRMPNVLFLVLKRFEFDFDTMQKVKVNDLCSFPHELDMSPYSQQELARQDLIKSMEEKNRSTDDLNEEEMHILKRKVPSNYYKYSLKGIVVHYGTSDQGHYYSFIQDREDPNAGWFEFNDTLVRDFDPSEIPEEAFGGDDASLSNNITEMQAAKGGQVDQAMITAMRQFKTKIKNAYVLIYDRHEVYDMAKANDVMDDTKIGNLPPKEQQKQYQKCLADQDNKTAPQIPPVVHDVILGKNKKFWLSKTIFNVDFIQKMHLMYKDIKLKDDQDYEKFMQPGFDLQASGSLDQFEAFKFLITFFLTVALRSKERTVLPDYLSLIREALNKNIGLCLWLLETFSNQVFIREFLLDCPIHDLSRFTQGLLKTAMYQVYQKEKAQIAHFSKLIAGQTSNPLDYYREILKGYIKEETVLDCRNLPEELELEVYSGCSEANVLRIGAHDKRLPKLICFMNAFIHTSTSFYCLCRFKTTGQFWSIFANFSLLGAEARQYLLQTRTLGRLIDVFLNLQNDKFFTREAMIQYQQKFRDVSLRKKVPLIIIQKELSIGMDPERGKVQMSSLERKQVANFISPTATFLALAISNLTRSCQFVKSNGASQGASSSTNQGMQTGFNFSLDNLCHVPDKEEIELLHSYNNPKWWQINHSKLTRNSIAVMFAHIATDNLEFTKVYITHLLDLIDESETIYIRLYERALLRLIQIGDKLQAERVKRIQQRLFEIFKSNLSFYLVADAITEITLKMSLRSPVFAQSLAKQQGDLYKIIDRYFKENHTLPICSNKIRVFKEGQIKWNEIKPNFLNKQKLEWISNYTRTRFNKLTTHLKRSPQEQENIAKICAANDQLLARYSDLSMSEFDSEGQMAKMPQAQGVNDSASTHSSTSKKTSATSVSQKSQQTNQLQIQEDLFDADDDMFGRTFQPGQHIDFRQNERWHQGIIEIALDEMVKCVAAPNADGSQPQNRLVHWIELESDALAPANSITSSSREHLAQFINDLMQFNTSNPYTNNQQ